MEVQQPASGMAAALDPILRACGGVWIAHGAGDADRDTVNERNEVRVPPADPKYTLRRVWLTEEQEKDYYFGCANQSIWPLCHVVFTRPGLRTALLGGVPRSQPALRPKPSSTKPAIGPRSSSSRTTISRCCRACSRTATRS